MTRIAGAHVIVTGGSQGIGLATADACARRGARVSILARSPKRLAEAQGQLTDAVAIASADVTDPVALNNAMDDLAAVHGPCDILVASAGRAEPGHFLDLGPEVFHRQMEVNYLGALHAVHAVLPSMLDRGHGHLVLLSSVAGLIGVFGYGAYTPTKFAVRGLGEALDAEFRHRGIRTSLVYPPDTDTPGFEQENLTKPPETARISEGITPVPATQVADAIVRGIERDRLHVTADWQSRVLTRLADLHGPPLRAMFRRQVRRMP
jgi:3-dehydrosphinganine reductase